jgi:hypothetical protein
MRQLDELVEVRKGPVPGFGADGPEQAGATSVATMTEQRAGVGLPREERPITPLPADGPQQFLWRGRLWQVREVLAHWTETGAWWLRRPEEAPGRSVLARQREVWRVSAARGRDVATPGDPGFGIFDLAFDAGRGVWRLAAALD